MIVEYIRYAIDDARRDEFERAYREAEASLRASPHCLGYELSRCVDEPSAYVVRIEWDSAQGHLEGFRKSGEFRSFLQSIRPYVGDIQEMRHYEVLRSAS